MTSGSDSETAGGNPRAAMAAGASRSLVSHQNGSSGAVYRLTAEAGQLSSLSMMSSGTL